MPLDGSAGIPTLDTRFADRAAPPLEPTLLAEIRERLPEINAAFEKPSQKMQDEWSEFLERLDGMHGSIIMSGKEDDFETNWQFGRLLHNIGRTKDALHYVTKASELQPDNLKCEGRTVEILLDLNAMMPNRSYEEPAYYLASKLNQREQSSYTAALLARADYAMRNPRDAFDEKLRADL